MFYCKNLVFKTILKFFENEVLICIYLNLQQHKMVNLNNSLSHLRKNENLQF